MTTEIPSNEEVQLNKILQQATKEYGDIERTIRALQKEKSNTPRLVPGGAGGKDDKASKIDLQIQYLRQDQKKIKDAVATKLHIITKNSSPEVKEKLQKIRGKWEDSSVAAAAPQQEKFQERKDDLSEEQDRFLAKMTKAEERREDLTEEQDRFAEKIKNAQEKLAISEKIEPVESPGDKAKNSQENSTEKTDDEEEKKLSEEEEFNREVEEMKKLFTRNKSHILKH